MNWAYIFCGNKKLQFVISLSVFRYFMYYTLLSKNGFGMWTENTVCIKSFKHAIEEPTVLVSNKGG
jgi:hypothetical protein